MACSGYQSFRIILKNKNKDGWTHTPAQYKNGLRCIDLCINDGNSNALFLVPTTRKIYDCLVYSVFNKNDISPPIFNILEIETDETKEVFLRHFIVCKDTKLQEFQYKIQYSND